MSSSSKAWLLGAAVSLLLLATVTVLQSHQQSPAGLLAPEGWRARAPHYIAADEARHELSAFFDTLHDRSAEWQPELQQQQALQHQPQQLHAVSRPSRALQKIEDALAKKRREIEKEKKMIGLEREELAVQSKLELETRAQTRFELKDKSEHAYAVRTVLKMAGQGGAVAGQGDASTNAAHAGTNAAYAETGNPVKDAEIVKKSDRKERPSTECIPPKAEVNGETI